MPKWTEAEKDFLMRSGFSFQSDALDYYAQEGDLNILPLIDKVIDDPVELRSEKEHMLWTCQLLINYYEKQGDEEKVKLVQSKREEIKKKLKK